MCGPISNALVGGRFDPVLRNIFETLAQRLERAGFNILSAHRQEAYGERIPSDPSEVFRRDWHLMQLAAAMVVVLPRLFRTDGTFMELGWAMALGKPLFIVTNSDTTGRSYLFDGLLGLPSCARRFELAEAMHTDRLAEAVWRAVAKDAPVAAGSQVAFCCTSFGFGPVSKTVAVAEAIRLLRPAYRLIFIGSNLAEDYARSSAVFDEIISADVEAAPEDGVRYARDCDALVNTLNFEVISLWSRQMPPHFFLDSLAWMWPSVPEAVSRARAYFVQDYLLGASTSGAPLPANTVLVPPILSPAIRAPRAEWEGQDGYLLVNLAGCRNPILPPDYYARYVAQMLAGLADALRRIDREGLRPINRVVVCGNGDLLDAARAVDWTGLSFPVERRFLPPREFLLELRRCELLLTSPGLTATLEALALGVPFRLLLPQNYSQFRIVSHYRSLGLGSILWPGTLTSERLSDPLLPEEEGVREVSRLLEEQLDRGVDEISQYFQQLIVPPGTKQETALLGQRLLSRDGGLRVAEYVVREIEAGAACRPLT